MEPAHNIPHTAAQPPSDADVAAAEFVYSVSHDLSAPVRAMVEFSKLLTHEHANGLNDEGKEYLAVIVENGKKMQAMMEGLLHYSRLNTTAQPMTEVDVAALVEEARAALATELAAAHAVIECGALPRVVADQDQLVQVFQALIENAIKFHSKDTPPHIVLSAEESHTFWKFSVVDTGIGIAPQHAKKIFKLFQRLHTETEYPGLGLGLTFAQKIVQRHGGTIWCESASVAGTAFHFTLSKPETQNLILKINAKKTIG